MTIVFNSFFVASFALLQHKLWSICRRAHLMQVMPVRFKLKDSSYQAPNYLLGLGIAPHSEEL